MTNEQRRLEGKQKQTALRKLERQEANALLCLEELEKEKTRLEAELARPDVYSNGERAREVKLKLDECAAAIEVKTREWEAIASEAEKYES